MEWMQVTVYEAVHPFTGWQDLKRRLAPDRRVFGYFHSSMPEEPLVLLHTALMDAVPSSMDQIMSQGPQGRTETLDKLDLDLFLRLKLAGETARKLRLRPLLSCH